MASDKYLMFSMEDDRIKKLAGVLGNKTCEDIIDFLADNDEASEKDISDGLKIPLNTVDYNIKKLVESGIVEKKKKFFWSVKGKKIVTYGLSNKSIMISPKKTNAKSKAKSIMTGILGVGIATALVGFFTRPQKVNFVDETAMIAPKIASSGEDARMLAEAVPEYASQVATGASDVARDTTINNINIFTEAAPATPFWVWFLVGGLVALFIFSIVNWKKL
jgi:DNA-binding transcriptional ArsR family regulator